MYFPIPCVENEFFFYSNDIDPSKYTKIRWDKADVGFQEGYCVDKKEYCSLNACDTIMKLSTIDFFGISPLIINFGINFIIVIFVIRLAGYVRIQNVIRFTSLLKIAVITVLGYFIDSVAFVFIKAILISTICAINNPIRTKFCGTFNYKSSVEETMTAPIFFIAYSVALLFVFVMVTLLFYKVYGSQLGTNKRKKLGYAAIFGVFSNPVWYFLLRFLLV